MCVEMHVGEEPPGMQAPRFYTGSVCGFLPLTFSLLVKEAPMGKVSEEQREACGTDSFLLDFTSQDEDQLLKIGKSASY